MKLVAADALPSANHQMDGLQPVVYWYAAFLKYHNLSKGGLLCIVMALFETVALDAANGLSDGLALNAGRTEYAILQHCSAGVSRHRAVSCSRHARTQQLHSVYGT